MRILKNAFGIITMLLLAVSPAFTQGNNNDYQEGRIYVRLKPNIIAKTGEIIPAPLSFNLNQLPFANKLSDKYKIKRMGRAFGELASHKLNATTVLEFERTDLTNELIATLKKDPMVELVERIPQDRRFLTPNDPSLANQWFLTKINAQGAWNYFSTGSTAVVAVVDDAVERSHPDLSANIWVNPGEIAGNGLDDDGNGYADDVNGWDMADNDPNPDPPTTDYSHGTHVAGIVGASTNNGIGIASIGYSVKLMCVKASGANPNSISHGYAGIIYAANKGAHVINCSWGSSTYSATSQEVIDFAVSKGCIMVVAAGNNNSSNLYYPAAYNGAISVAATDINDVKSSFSNYGEWVKISAPGSNILSTVPYGGYAAFQGTSMASPLVAGLVGLMKSVNPSMPNNDLINCLYSTCQSILFQNPTIPGQLGAGRINAEAALACVAATVNRAPIADFTANATNVVEGSSITFTDRSYYTPTQWEWLFPGGTPASFTGKTPPAIVYNTPGAYSVTLTVSNAHGQNAKTVSNMITVNAKPSCVSINYPATGTILDFLAPPAGANGFQNGVNANGDKQKAMYFDASSTNLTGLTAIYVRFNHINSINPDKKVYFRVYDGTSETPGALLGVVERTKGQLRQNVQANQYTIIDLPKNIDLPASKKFFLSVDISELVWTTDVKDSLSIRASVSTAPPVSPIWYQNSSGTWIRYGTPGSTWANAAQYLLIHPFLTSKPAKSIISPTNPVVCQGTLVEFDGTGSVYNDLLKWEMPGANAPTVVENQIKVTPQYTSAGIYKIYLSTRGGCNEIRTDSAVLTINASPVVNILASKNPICLGETATLTASGATTYTWTPGTGLSATTGAQVQANPTVSTRYTITGTTGNCSTEVPLELEVKARNTNVVIGASETNITGATSVTFTAVAVNGGSTPNYHFRVNTQSVQNGANNVMVRTVSPGDKVICEFTSSEPCVDEKTVTSNEIIMGEGTLPVTLVALSGRKVTDGNRLEWVTASEFNSDKFMVEKSADGARFENIGQVSAAGISNNITAYQFLDTKPNTGNNYYRLKMIDRDATFRYSNVLLLNNETIFRGSKLYPNPTNTGRQVFMQLEGLERGAVTISISGINGQIIKTFRATSTDGTLQMNIPATGINSGSYLIICRDSKGNIVETMRWQVAK
jgi:subtilisin family serine protease